MELLKINGHDYSRFVEQKGYSWSRNDIDSEQTTRLKNGSMRRKKLTTKRKLSYTVFRMSREQLAALDDDLNLETVSVTYLDLHGEQTRTFYCSAFAADCDEIGADGASRWSGGAFHLIEI